MTADSTLDSTGSDVTTVKKDLKRERIVLHMLRNVFEVFVL